MQKVLRMMALVITLGLTSQFVLADSEVFFEDFDDGILRVKVPNGLLRYNRRWQTKCWKEENLSKQWVINDFSQSSEPYRKYIYEGKYADKSEAFKKAMFERAKENMKRRYFLDWVSSGALWWISRSFKPIGSTFDLEFLMGAMTTGIEKGVMTEIVLVNDREEGYGFNICFGLAGGANRIIRWDKGAKLLKESTMFPKFLDYEIKRIRFTRDNEGNMILYCDDKPVLTCSENRYNYTGISKIMIRCKNRGYFDDICLMKSIQTKKEKVTEETMETLF